MRDPSAEIISDLAGEEVAGFIQREGADEANPPPRAEVGVGSPKHLFDPCPWIGAVAQGRKDIFLEPAIYVADDRSRHLLLPAGKEVIEASLAQPRRFADQGQAGAFITMRTKNLGHDPEQLVAVGRDASHAGLIFLFEHDPFRTEGQRSKNRCTLSGIMH